ncbi:hypothetical protein GCM10027277_36220 [Pseudoduganella ginsengisoli]|uniref:Lipoprotein n=1 Tax=Pseudoduganella ginsengisoli TaxID=1462440 RepID=A0A6L6PYL3_9BURK|nr:hypothetical protein [Pseudoduganella ginsengisoli]MTW02244.1 hypothetical protein [Pseudoduganella ginsengisoli]
MAFTVRHMYLTLVAAGLALCSVLNAAHAADVFGIEDENLQPVPPAVAAALRAHVRKTEYRECAQGDFVGSAVDLQGQGRNQDWIAKTADGCAWGAATAKIWILKHDMPRYRVVLDTGGHGVDLLKSTSHGLRNLSVSSGTAGHYSDALLKFNGRRYKVFKSCFVDPGNPEEASKHPDGQCHIN